MQFGPPASTLRGVAKQALNLTDCLPKLLGVRGFETSPAIRTFRIWPLAGDAQQGCSSIICQLA